MANLPVMHHEYIRSPAYMRMDSYWEDEGFIVLIAVLERILPLSFNTVRVNAAFAVDIQPLTCTVY